MLKKVSDIAHIATGIYEKGSPSGDTLYLQAKHFDDHGEFRWEAGISPEINLDRKLERHLLLHGDILLIAKGDTNKACLYKNKIGRAVASSTFFVIRITDPNILPEYLQWYFNTAYMQAQFSGLSKGTQILSISKKMLMEVVVLIPAVEIQKQVLDVQQLWDKEKALTLELLEQKYWFYKAVQTKLTKSYVKNEK